MARLLPAACLLLLCACPAANVPSDLVFNSGIATLQSSDPATFQTETLPGVSDKTGYHAASITQLADERLLAAWYSYDASQSELTGSAIYTAIRNDQGWEPPTLHRDSPQGDGNPVLYSEGSRVWLFQAVVPGGWSTAHIEFQTSEGQDQWSDPMTINGPMGSNVKYPPIRLASGELLLPAYNDLMSRSLFFSSDDGIAWQQRAVLSTGLTGTNIQPSVVQLASGRLLAIMRDTKGRSIWVSCSDDNGYTWSQPQASGFPNPASASALLRLSNNRLALVFNNAPDRVALSVTLSADDGVTWTTPKVIAADASSYPFAIQTDDGQIHVVYSQGREAIVHAWFNEAWAVSP